MMVLLWASIASAFPKYTTRENALRLAKVIDKGIFKSYKIASAFVKNRTPHEFYLQVILDDGSSHEWYMDRIYQWVLNDQLLLTENRVLIFPSDESTEFNILDKNAFYRKVLQATAFVKRFEEHDMLAGGFLKFAIRRFRLIQPDDDDVFATDELGNRFRYVLEFKNGSREVLSYLSAYQLLHSGAFIMEPEPTDLILERAFQVQEVVSTPKKVEDELRSIWSFGVEVRFDKPIHLSPNAFPFQIVEESNRDPKTGERMTRFYIHVLFPNTEKVKEIPEIRTLEYLQHVSLVTDIANQNRVFLRAQINPEIFELPPYIEVTDRNSVVVHFFSVTDQSVAKRKEFVEQEFPDDGIHPALRPVSRDTEYDKFYLSAVDQIRRVQGSHSLSLKIGSYLEAVELLQKAALSAKTDQQISQALQQRDVLYEILPRMIVENAQLQLERTDNGFDQALLLEQLDEAEQITTNREYLNQLRMLRTAMMN